MEYAYKSKYTTYYNLVCQTCGKSYIGKAKNQKYCCDECKPKHKSKYVPVEKPINNYICHGCGRQFESKYKNQIWCSEECQKQYHKIHCHKEYVSKAVREERVCLKCGKAFISSNAKQKFCSKKCGKNAYIHHERTQKEINNEAFEKKIDILNEYGFDYVSGYKNQKSIITIECQKCGAPKNVQVDSIREKRKTICTHCIELEQQRKQEDLEIKKRLLSVLKGVERIRKAEEKEVERLNHWEETHRPRKCKCCGTEFVPNTLQQKKCEVCRKQRKEKRVSKEKRNRSLTWKTLWNKGQHNCALCGKECDINDFYTKENGTIICGDNYPSLDHIVPVFMGGGDFLNNVQLACRKCNTLRGVREWQEYRKSQKQTLKV